MKAAVLGAVSAVILAAGALPAQADPATSPGSRSGPDKDVTYKVIPYVISDPELVADPQKVIEELNRAWKEHGE